MKKYKSHKSRKLIITVFSVLLIGAWSTPAAAISLKEEQQLANEFMKFIVRHYELINDPAIVRYVNQIGQKILATMPAQPFKYRFYVIKEETYNAFAIPAGHIFINSGLLAAMESEDELAGILGHEIAHIVCRHISQRIERSKKINLATMAGMVAGAFLGITTGDAAAAQALTIGSAAAGQTASLAYSREDEAQADELGIQYIIDAGYSIQGLSKVLEKIRSKQWYGTEQVPTYMMTHPAVEERIVWIDNWTATHPGRKKRPEVYSPDQATMFKMVNVRIKALYGDPNGALQHFKNALAQDPKNADLAYGYGLALANVGKREEAAHYLKQALAQNALDPFILGDLGRVYFLSGRYQEALGTLEGAVSLSAGNSEGLFYLGRTQLELGQLEKASRNFELLIDQHKDYQQAYYFLGETYGKLGQMAEAHFHLGIYYYRKNEYRTARFHLTRAQKMIDDPVKLKVIDKALKPLLSKL